MLAADNSKSQVSISVVRRMSRYLRHLEELENEGISRISSQMMANQLGLTASQIRQDLNSFGGFGQQGYGYSVEYLKSNIEAILGVHHKSRAIMICAGSFGGALIRSIDLDKCGVTLVGAIDSDAGIAGTQMHGIEIQPMEMLDEVILSAKPQMAILALPTDSVRKVAEHIVSLGVRGIWNFSNVDLHISDPGVVVEDVHIADSLLTLSFRLNQLQ